MEAVVVALILVAVALVVGHLIARRTWPMRARRWRRRAYIVEYEARHTPDSGLEETSDVSSEEPDEPPPRMLDDEERERRRAAGLTTEDLDY